MVSLKPGPSVSKTRCTSVCTTSYPTLGMSAVCVEKAPARGGYGSGTSRHSMSCKFDTRVCTGSTLSSRGDMCIWVSMTELSTCSASAIALQAAPLDVSEKITTWCGCVETCSASTVSFHCVSVCSSYSHLNHFAGYSDISQRFVPSLPTSSHCDIVPCMEYFFFRTTRVFTTTVLEAHTWPMETSHVSVEQAVLYMHKHDKTPLGHIHSTKTPPSMVWGVVGGFAYEQTSLASKTANCSFVGI